MPGTAPALNPYDPLESIDSYIISCAKVSAYEYTRVPPRAYICEACALPILRNMPHFEGHGFSESLHRFDKCHLCKKSLIRTQPIINCPSCLSARESVFRQLEEQGILRKNVKDLTYDTMNRELTRIKYLKPPTYNLVSGISANRLRYERQLNRR
jgi:hypothetical protein